MGILQQLNFHLHHHPFREVLPPFLFFLALFMQKVRGSEGTISYLHDWRD
jgi:hypothetical protein